MRRVRGFKPACRQAGNPGVLNGNIELEIAARKGKKFQTKIKGAK